MDSESEDACHAAPDAGSALRSSRDARLETRLRDAGGSACDRGRRCSRPVPRRRGARDGMAPRSGSDSNRAHCRPPDTRSATRPPRPPRGSSTRCRTGCARWPAGRWPAKPRTRRQSIGTSKVWRAPSKYSSSWRRTRSVRSGASRMRGETRSASSSSWAAIPSPGYDEPHQAARGDHHRQRPERRVVGAVGRRRAGRRRRPGAPARPAAAADRGPVRGRRASARRRSSSSVTASPPGAAGAGRRCTFWRAASSLVPIRAPISA